MLSSRNPVVSFIATIAVNNTDGILGRNRAFLSIKYQDGRLIWDFIVPLQHAPVGSWTGMGLINYDGIECEFFPLYFASIMPICM